jgi:hypothetical protein
MTRFIAETQIPVFDAAKQDHRVAVSTACHRIPKLLSRGDKGIPRESLRNRATSFPACTPSTWPRDWRSWNVLWIVGLWLPKRNAVHGSTWMLSCATAFVPATISPPTAPPPEQTRDTAAPAIDLLSVPCVRCDGQFPCKTTHATAHRSKIECEAPSWASHVAGESVAATDLVGSLATSFAILTALFARFLCDDCAPPGIAQRHDART